MNAGYGAAQTAPKESTINDRLNSAASGINFNLDRIEGALARVNGTPRDTKASGQNVAQIQPTLALFQVMEMLEGANARLGDLANGVERIA